jgi:hypothetical protein
MDMTAFISFDLLEQADNLRTGLQTSPVNIGYAYEFSIIGALSTRTIKVKIC